METQVSTQLENNKQYTGKQKIVPFLWFDDNAEDAVNFYISVFKNAGITAKNHYSESGAKAAGRKPGSVMIVSFQIEGFEISAINGGPVFKMNPSVSFFVNCKTIEEIDALWSKLSENGEVMMALDNYPFAEKYGWVQDKFGVSWQLIIQDREQKITPCFMFSGNHHLMAEDAIKFYTSVFSDSKIIDLVRYETNQGPEGAVVHCKFLLNGIEFVAMDSHMFMPVDFNPAISLVIDCETQEDIDYYWDKLTEGGDEHAQQCGWLQDKFGFSWQVVPSSLAMLMSSDPVKSDKAMQAVLQMKKIDIGTVLKAIEQ